MKPRVSIIVAMAKNRVIGANNALPWHLSSDLKRFKALTMGHHIIMGRKTFESIGRVLPGRTNVVVTRDRKSRFEGAVVAHCLREALEKCGGDDEVFVIGGEQIFREALSMYGASNGVVASQESHATGNRSAHPAIKSPWKMR